MGTRIRSRTDSIRSGASGTGSANLKFVLLIDVIQGTYRRMFLVVFSEHSDLPCMCALPLHNVCGCGSSRWPLNLPMQRHIF